MHLTCCISIDNGSFIQRLFKCINTYSELKARWLTKSATKNNSILKICSVNYKQNDLNGFLKNSDALREAAQSFSLPFHITLSTEGQKSHAQNKMTKVENNKARIHQGTGNDCDPVPSISGGITGTARERTTPVRGGKKRTRVEGGVGCCQVTNEPNIKKALSHIPPTDYESLKSPKRASITRLYRQAHSRAKGRFKQQCPRGVSRNNLVWQH